MGSQAIQDHQFNLMWNYYKEQREQGRSFDTQRSAISSILITLQSVIAAYLFTEGAAEAFLPLAVLVVIFSISGLYAVHKLYERQELHYDRARALLEYMDQSWNQKTIEELIQQSKSVHYERFSDATKLESRMVWIVLHGMMLIYGLGLIVSSFF